MKNSWIVLVELHTSPGGARALPFAGKPLRSPSEMLLRAARLRGHRTAVATADRAYYEDHFDGLVDAWLTTDTTDPQMVQQTLVALDSRIAGVCSAVDSFVRIAAQVARDLGLRGPDPQGIGIARDKAKARQALADAAVENTRWGVRHAGDPDLASPIGYPCIVKPVDGAYSWDVALVQSDDDVMALARKHLERRYPRRIQPRHELLFEEYFEGPLISAEGFVDGEELAIFGYSDRVMSPPPKFVELALRFAADSPAPEIEVFVRRALCALGYDFGPFHLEFILTKDGPRLVELNARLVGAGMEQAIGYVANMPLAEYVLSKIIGGSPALACEGAVTELYLTASESGLLQKAEGIEDAVKQPGCMSAGLYYAYGEAVSRIIESNSSYVGYVHATGTSREHSHRNALHAAHGITFGVTPM
ncbi:ATP-grasp domain-containing protein [Streptomyces sp. NPDC090053]|uniref:ATP-grasp domain-containing protein n=1 Tax=Streptomyces sp. NPDC090053 TaxID=3365932 RepID=UPI003823C175